EAAQAIELLDRNKNGKANFFVLNRFGQYEAQKHEAKDGLIPALSVVSVDEQYMPLAQHLLGHVYIAENGHSLTADMALNGQVVVEKSGKMVRGKYTLGGGSIGLFEGNKIGRAKNLERLAKEIEDLTRSEERRVWKEYGDWSA